jgi:hypothetical protein
MSKLIPQDTGDWLDRWLEGRAVMVVNGVPIVPVTVDELLEPLDEPFDQRLTDLGCGPDADGEPVDRS